MNILFLFLIKTKRSILVFIPLFYFSALFGQTKQQFLQIASSYEQEVLARVSSRLEQEYKFEMRELLAFAKQNNLKDTLANGISIELHSIGEDGTPLYYESYSNELGKATRASALNSNGVLGLSLEGAGMQVGVWDSGIAFTNHIEYNGRVIVGDDSANIDSHATRVTGSLISTGINKDAKGIANEATVLTHDWTRDKIEAINAARDGLLLSNHSYGIKGDRVPDWYFGAYTKVAHDWDKIMFSAPYYLMVTAAGNAQRSGVNAEPIDGKSSEGYDVLLGFSLTKNGITVAAANTDIDKQGHLKQANVSAYSSFGPVDDGRIKPDLAGNGAMILSTNSSSNDGYMATAGTSMAAPGVTGSLLLLQQYNEILSGSYLKSASLKGLALHTADDVHEKGPDYKMGWGVMNAMSAAELLLNRGYTSHLSEEKLLDGETFTMTFNTDGVKDITASISWTDPESEFINRGELNNTTAALVNDLDIRITKDGETFFPWKLNAKNVTANAIQGDNRVDPFERIEIPNASGTYTVTISHKGKLKNAVQDFSLIVSGVQLNTCTLIAPNNIDIINTDKNSLHLQWDAIADGLFEVQYKAENDIDWITIYADENQQVLSNLIENESYVLQMKTFCSQNLASAYSNQYRFDFIGSATVLESLNALSADNEIPFTVYPNPAVNELKINLTLSDTARFQIVNTGGAILKNDTPKDAKVNVSDLASGLYILQIEDQGVIAATKFYKE